MLSQGGGGLDRTAVALAINLSLAPGNAEQLAAKGQLRQLVRSASQTMDNCLLKLIRNLSAHELPYREEFRAYVDELLAMSIRCDNHDVLVEVLGIVSNMNSGSCDLEGLVHKFDHATVLRLQRHTAGGQIIGRNVSERAHATCQPQRGGQTDTRNAGG